MNNVFISVIIPSYKPQEYFVNCLKSLKNQSLSKHLFEVIIVLNGERNVYYEFVKGLINDFNFFSLIYTESEGVSNARNLGIKAAKGNYIMFIDDDDFISETALLDLHSLAMQSMPDIVLMHFKNIETNGLIKDSYIKESYFKRLMLTEDKNKIIDYRKFLSSSCGKLIRKNIIGSVQFKKKMKVSEDALFMFEISGKILNVKLNRNKSYYYRNVRDNSVSNAKVNLSSLILRWLKSIIFFTQIYVQSNFEQSFLLYVNRLLALTKFMILKIKKSNY